MSPGAVGGVCGGVMAKLNGFLKELSAETGSGEAEKEEAEEGEQVEAHNAWVNYTGLYDRRHR